ncbi:MAG: PEP-CTERM sorting domain-containing protein [Verrucomicrobiota bacterium]
MKTPVIFRSLVAAAFAVGGSAQAAFHLFEIQEIYTNSAGTVQFIELFTAFGGQQFLAGHSITFQLNGVSQTPFSLSDLPGDTSNKTFLVGTANLTTLYNVTPDFIIPASFFTAGANNFINFAEGTDRVNLTLLPTNGTSALNGLVGNTGQTAAATSVNAQATPRNFAGQTATIPEPATAALVVLALGGTTLRRRRC